MEYLEEHTSITNREYRELNDVSKNTEINDLSEMVEKDFLKIQSNW